MARPATELSFVIRDVGLGMTLLESFTNGIYTVIFSFTLYLLFSRRHTKYYTGCKYMLTTIVTLYLLSMIHLACRWNMVRRAFVLDGATRDTILQSFLRQPTWSIALSGLSLSLMTLIADCVMIWRCWVVWDRDWRAPVLPALATTIGTVFCAFSLMYQIEPSSQLYTADRAKFSDPGLVYFSLSLASTVFSTLLIVYRIVSISRRTMISNRYHGVIEIITESAALYAVALIVFLPFMARKDFTQGYAQAVLIPVTGIAPTIITARVSLGLAREQTVARTTATSYMYTRDSNSLRSSTIRVNVSQQVDSSFREPKELSEKSVV